MPAGLRRKVFVMICSKCNHEISDNLCVCPYCNTPTSPAQAYAAPSPAPQPCEEKASVGLAVLSFLIPLAGLIIYLVKKDTEPKTAKLSGKCALISFIINLAIYIISFIAIMGGLSLVLA